MIRTENPERAFSAHETLRGVLREGWRWGGPQRGGLRWWNCGTRVPTHTPGPALSNRVFSPNGSRQNCWQMTLPPCRCYHPVLPTRSSVDDRGDGCSSTMLRAEKQWNSRAGGVVTFMGDCNSAGSLNSRGPPHDPR